MERVQEQVRGWADATAANAAADGRTGGAVTAAEAIQVASAARGRGTGPGVRRPGPGRLLAVAAAVLVLLGIGALAWVIVDDGDGASDQDVATEGTLPSDGEDDGDGDAGSAEPTGEVGFRVLTVTEAGGTEPTNPMGTLRAATDQASFDELWAAAVAGGPGPLPDVDLDAEVVVSITIPDDACPPTLEGLERTGRTITPRFVEPSGGCRDKLVPRTFVVALDWATIGSSFTLFLPGQPTYDFESTYLPVTRPRFAPDCVAVEAFADDLARVRAGDDHQPTSSPDELAERSDVVVNGWVAPGTTVVETEAGPYAVYQVDHGHLIEGGDHPEVGGGVLRIFLATEEGAAKLPVGAEVVVFASWHAPFEGFVASLEGFATACAGGPPIGAVGTMGEWSEIDSLGELIHAVG